MKRIHGTTIILYDKKQVGIDPIGNPEYEEIPIYVDNVLIAPTNSEDIKNSLEIEGKKAVYILAIPKGDTNNWENRIVEFFNQKWKTFGYPQEGLDHLMPLDWNKKVMVERYG